MSISETVWAFDLGKGSIGEAVRKGNEFLHKESLLLPADFAETKTAAARRRMMRTRQAHKAREAWLAEVMRAAGIEPLQGRRVAWNEATKKWETTPGDYRLEREFAPNLDEKTMDGAPVDEAGTRLCYTSCLLRIKLLRGENMEPWQIYKALHAAIQKRGYDKDIPWKKREEKRTGKGAEESDADLAKKDPAYRASLEAWQRFKEETTDSHFHYPCFYAAAKMRLWNSEQPERLILRVDCAAGSTRKIRFDREAVNVEIIELGNKAAETLPLLQTAFRSLQQNGWLEKDEIAGYDKKTKTHFKGQRVRRLKVLATSLGEFICHGPGGKAYPSCDAKTVNALTLEVLEHPSPLRVKKKKQLTQGTTLDWCAATGQKIPRFENRILMPCALIPRLQGPILHTCNMEIRYDPKKGQARPESLLAAEVVFLLKLVNMRLLRRGQTTLTHTEIKQILESKYQALTSIPYDEKKEKKWAEDAAYVFRFTATDWRKWCSERLQTTPENSKDEIEAPSTKGRSRFSRPALKLIKELILSGLKPSEFHTALLRDDSPERKSLGLAIFAQDSVENRMKGLTHNDLAFLLAMRDKDGEESIFIPPAFGLEQTIKAIAMAAVKKPEAERALRDKTIVKIIGEQNNPVVRHRLAFFWSRLKSLEQKCHGTPSRIVLEFAREDFLGEKAKDRWKKFIKTKRDQNTEARANATSEKDMLKRKLWRDQGGECLYGTTVKKGKCVYTQRALPQPGTDDFDKLLEIDHIVPRTLGGPNAYLNYVLTFREVANQQKRERIPYVWFSQDRPTELHGYIEYVQSKMGSLGRKKVALLTRPDAIGLVQRYTALAETAWIARLAQTIIRIHFGWPLDHQQGQERVLVLTGGQTAQFRLNFRLNTLLGQQLNPQDQLGEVSRQDEEKAANQIQDCLLDEMKKNRVDQRHHALDAMVLSLIPEWRHYEAKLWDQHRARRYGLTPDATISSRPTPFFDAFTKHHAAGANLDKNEIRKLMASLLAEIHPSQEFFSKPRLEETHYAKHFQAFDKEKRIPLDEIACVHASDPLLRRFDPKKLGRWLERCIDQEQKKALDEFLTHKPEPAAWKLFKQLRGNIFRGGKVRVWMPTLEEKYTVRKELRMLAYENNPNKTEKCFKPEWVQEDARQIDDTTAGLHAIKAAVLNYLAQHPSPNENDFTRWLSACCEENKTKKITLHPLTDEREEQASKRNARAVPPDSFGCRKLPLAFDHKRILKTVVKICDPWIRQALRKSFEITGEGKQAHCRDFTREEWETFCQNFRKPAKRGKPGPQVFKITLFASGAKADDDEDETEGNGQKICAGNVATTDASATVAKDRDEFVESSKAAKTFLKGETHKGYFLFVDAKGHWVRRPVFAHEKWTAARSAFSKLKQAQQELPDSRFRDLGFFQTGCNVQIEKDVIKKGAVIARAGIYRLNTIKDDGFVKLTAQNGTKVLAQAALFIDAGLQRLPTTPKP